MSPLEVLQLIGYGTAAALPLWLGALLLKRRHDLSKIERVLLAMACGMGAWHVSQLLLTLHALLGLDEGRWVTLLRLADTVSVISVTFIYSFLLHIHLHLWARAQSRPLTRGDHIRVYLSYIPTIFLLVAVPRLWTGPYAPMFDRLSHLVLPFALWATYVLGLVAARDFAIARASSSPSERRLMQTLAASFVAIGLLIFAVHALGLGKGTTAGLYLETLANLGSLMPTALLAYHIYRYRYLELIITESLIVASFAVVVLVVYLYGIRTVGEWLTTRYALRPGVIESLLILTLALTAPPLRKWLDKRFHRLFEREAALYRDVVAHIGAHAGRYQQLPELLRFVEERTVAALGLRRVRFILHRTNPNASDNAGKENDAREQKRDGVEGGSVEGATWDEKVRERVHAWGEGGVPLEDEQLLGERGYSIAYTLSRENREVGLMLVDAAPDALTHDVRAVLEVLAGQVAIAVEDSRLVEENVRLERQLAQGERLAALGQMAATVAHEVKNPLSAIKSIAQVLREDERLGHEYTRDLDLIVGETDRLNRSVTQMLSFARSAPPTEATHRADELARAVVELFRMEANGRGILIESRVEGAGLELEGLRAAAVRDALSNLLLNALQATPAGGRILIEASLQGDQLLFAVTDGGAGVPSELRERIWEPFFTTKQRGTGLGLAIVRKRIEEVGGRARLAPSRDGEGARFELLVPVRRPA